MMKKIINDKLREIITGDHNIYVLKGFNSIFDKIDVGLQHVFDLNLQQNLLILDTINIQSVYFEAFQKLAKGQNLFCLYEEIVYLEKNNLIGIITANNYKLKIVDIGCFNYYYPGFNWTNCIDYMKEFDKNEQDSSYIQKFYTDFSVRDNNSIIAYNLIENENMCEYFNLVDSYSQDYINYTSTDGPSLELQENASCELYIKAFNDIWDGKYKNIVYYELEQKNDHSLKRFLYFVNLLGINIDKRLKLPNNENPELYQDYLNILKRINPGYNFKKISIYKDPFRNNDKIKICQSVVIDTVYQNILKAQKGESFKDIFVTAPTGAGKSVLFQIPAVLASEKQGLITLVISPLIGLMKDQVTNIKKITNAAATINSEYTPFEKETVKDKIKNGEISILYISPETLLGNNDITTFIGDRKIGLLVVDEAHTVATWGKNFRPDYWYLGDYVNNLRHKLGYIFPIATFTATATISNGNDDMYHDIIESLNMTPETFFGDVKRNDIHFDINVSHKERAYQEEKESVVLSTIRDYIKKDEKTLVYFPYVTTLNDIYDRLPTDKVGKYHGKLDKLDKDETLEDIRFGTKKVVLATKAFGMGIDVKDIKNVYHFAPTGNLADYVQEIGRAARDPQIDGIASTDYYEEDFRYINKLYGMSQITNYNIIGVLKKIEYKYKNANKRNFLIATEEFAHVFNANTDEEIENKLKATIIAIKKDFKNMSNYVPLIFKPRGMFTKGLFYIPDFKMPLVKSYGWAKYLEKKYDREDLNKMISSTSKISYLGDVYLFNFKQCWEDHYNGRFDGITFGQFKRDFYNGELKGIDKSCFLERMILTVEAKFNNSLEWVKNKALYFLDSLKDVLDDMKMSNKWYRTDEIASLLCQKDPTRNITKMKNVMDPLINLLISYDSNSYISRGKFCDYNSQNDRYHIVSPYYYRVINQIKDVIKSHTEGHLQDKRRISLVDTSKNKDRQMRNDPLLVAVQIMELLDLATYTLEAGNKPEFFIRINSEKTILKVIENREYRSKTLAAIQALHYDSVRYMKYFFEKLTTDEERWQFVEDYFLGKVEAKYDIGYKNLRTGLKSIDKTADDNEEILKQKPTNVVSVYTVFHDEDQIVAKYYISTEVIEYLENKQYLKLDPGCEVAKNLLKSKTGDIFSVNEYEYLIEKIEYYEE